MIKIPPRSRKHGDGTVTCFAVHFFLLCIRCIYHVYAVGIVVQRNTLYNGCLSEDVTVLKFVYFDARYKWFILNIRRWHATKFLLFLQRCDPFQYKSAARRAWVLTINHKWFRVTWKGGGVPFIFFFLHVLQACCECFIVHFHRTFPPILLQICIETKGVEVNIFYHCFSTFFSIYY